MVTALHLQEDEPTKTSLLKILCWMAVSLNIPAKMIMESLSEEIFFEMFTYCTFVYIWNQQWRRYINDNSKLFVVYYLKYQNEWAV